VSEGTFLVVPVGPGNEADLEFAALLLEEEFAARTQTMGACIPLRPFQDASRNQYDAIAIVTELERAARGWGMEHPGGAWVRILGITSADLFIPVMTFVFGQARLGGPAAVVSTHRLREEFYGLPGDEALRLRRLEKEILHEIGHTFGLKHCREAHCVMRFAPSVGEVDIKSAAFCAACRRRVPLRSE
jgi:archaemetzincin